ncbi:MAG TPA: DUF192 domain-containing protein [Acidimicrobiales bacterium]|nr:DUF192 domain-containing protein [Acidimicrobiales bacterium]
MRSGWLLRDGDVICALEMADSFSEKAKGLRGRPGCEGALHLPGVRSLHTVAMKFPVDVAFLTDELVVLRLARMPPWRVAFPRRGVHSVLEAEAGSWERWGVRVGDQLVIRAVE